MRLPTLIICGTVSTQIIAGALQLPSKVWFFCLSRRVGFFWCFFPEEETLDYLGRGPIVVVTVVHSGTPTVSILGDSGNS